jgi:hypothetical protein
MPIGPTRTKAQKQRVVHQEMHEFKEGKLHSGSKHGPVVKNRRQAIAIAMSESGQSKPHGKQPHPKTNPGGYDNSAHRPEGGYLRKGEEFRPGAEQVAEDAAVRAEENLRMNLGMQPASQFEFHHTSLSRSHTFGHGHQQRHGSLRLSGDKRAHRIGAK